MSTGQRVNDVAGQSAGTARLRAVLALLEQLTSIGDNWTEQKWNEVFDKVQQHSATTLCIYVVERNAVLIGAATLLIEPKFIHAGAKVAHIEDVVVDKDSRVRGKVLQGDSRLQTRTAAVLRERWL